MIIMSPHEIIIEIEHKHRKFLEYIPRLKKLEEKYPHVLVALSVGGGDCEADGFITPITEDGNPDDKNKRFIRQGEPMPQEPFVFVPER